METTFITIHDLSPHARILYTSDSIIDILGYAPEEVVNKPCWDFFHKDEIPFARARHGQGVEMDKAAVLSYCLIRDKAGSWIGCEVVFTVVFDVMVGCTSIYKRGLKSRNRAANAPVVRRLFSNSPRDPRYHMLSHLSTKFDLPPIAGAHEPRAALFLNRYTRTLTIMYATEGLADVLGISGEQLRGKSFYYCIEENCLQDAVRCLENAKANDSIAYLRFWYRDPREEHEGRNWRRARHDESNDWGDETMDDITDEDGEDNVGNFSSHSPALQHQGMREQSNDSMDSEPVSSTDSVEPVVARRPADLQHNHTDDSRTSSGRSSVPFTHEAVFGEALQRNSSTSSISNSPTEMQPRIQRGNNRLRDRIELEAVVSCTSDGLVVCMRRARAVVSNELRRAKPVYTNGLFAVPWATEPMLPPLHERPLYEQRNGLPPTLATAGVDHTPTFYSPKPGQDDFMNAIREIAVFAWALTGINGSMAEYSHGQPRGESQPASGLPIWQPEATQLRNQASASDGFNTGHTVRASPNQKSDGSHSTSTVPQSSGFPIQQASAFVDGEDHIMEGMDDGDIGSDRHTSQSSHGRGTSLSPVNSRSYQLVPTLDGQSKMADGLQEVERPYGSLGEVSGGRSRNTWSPQPDMGNHPNDGHGAMMDGIGSNLGQKRSPSNPYGFGDPGLSSKGHRSYRSAHLQEASHHTAQAPGSWPAESDPQ